jgi:hypothetical protein
MYNCIIPRITGGFHFVRRLVFSRPENTTFRKLDLFPFSGEGGKHLLCWVPPPHQRIDTDPVSETLCSLVSRIPDNGQSERNQ